MQWHFTDKTQLGSAIHCISDLLTPSVPAYAQSSSAAGRKPLTLTCLWFCNTVLWSWWFFLLLTWISLFVCLMFLMFLLLVQLSVCLMQDQSTQSYSHLVWWVFRSPQKSRLWWCSLTCIKQSKICPSEFWCDCLLSRCACLMLPSSQGFPSTPHCFLL